MLKRLSKEAKRAISITLFTAALLIFSVSAVAFEEVNTTVFGVAIKGYDPVAYHTEGRAVKGLSEFSYEWNDAKWQFISAANRDLFAADPLRYAPQYGGY